MIGRMFCCCIVLLLFGSAGAQEGKNPDAPYSKPPKLEPGFRDEFNSDSRENYKMGGRKDSVTWKKGRLTLEQGAIVQRNLASGPWVEMEIHLEFPNLEKDGQTSELKVWFDLENSTDSFVLFQQIRENGKTRSALRIVDTKGNWNQKPQEQPIYTLSIDAPLKIGRWQINYRQGLILIQGPKPEFHLLGHINNGPARIEQIALETINAPINIHAARVNLQKRVEYNPQPDVVSKIKEASAQTQKLIQLYRAGRAKEAAEIGKKVRSVRLRHLGRFHSSYAASLNNLAAMYRAMSQYELAEPLYVEAKEINEEVLGKQHPYYAQCLNNLAMLYLNISEYEKAEPILIEAKTIRENIYGTQHPTFAQSLHNLASLYQITGDYERAEPLFLQALDVREKVLGKQNPTYATVLNSLAALYRALGDYEKAEPLFLESKSILEKVIGKRHPAYANSLNNLAELYLRMNELKKAEPLFLEAMAIQEKVFGKQHPSFALSLHNLGGLYQLLQDYKRAEQMYLEAKAIREKALGKQHPDYGSSLSNLAVLNCDMGNYEKAEKLYLESLAIEAKTLGKQHPDYSNGLYNLASSRVLANKLPLAFNDSQLAVSIRLQNLDRYSLVQSESQQRKYLGKNRATSDLMLTIAEGLPQMHADAFQLEIQQKGSVLARQKSYRQLARKSDTAGLFSQLQEIASQLAKHTASDPTQPKWAERNRSLQEQYENLEKQIALKSAEFRSLKKTLEVSEYVQSLPKKSCLVSFTQFNYLRKQPQKNPKFKAIPHLAVFVVLPQAKSDQPNVKMMDLGPVNTIDRLVAQWRGPIEQANLNGRGITSAEQKVMDNAGMELRKLLWEPLENQLNESDLVIVSPDGSLGRMPLLSLPGKEPGTFLIEEKKIVYLPVPSLLPQMLAKSAGSIESSSNALLVGDIDYGDKISDAQDGNLRNSRILQKLQFGSLPNSGKEVNEINALFQNAVQLKNQGATEKEFQSRLKDHSILHIATHGFFQSPDRFIKLLPRDNSQTLVALQERARVLNENPNMLSGLAFANANSASKRTSQDWKNDGILYSAEIAMMPMENVELAVLSACETSLGTDDNPGEGLIGIQRAFQVAGVKSTIASYWKVNDKATQMLMNRFYKNLLAKRNTAKQSGKAQNSTTIRIDALRDAQLWMLRGLDKKQAEFLTRGLDDETPVKDIKLKNSTDPKSKPEYISHPRYWAAFVLSGDWR